MPNTKDYEDAIELAIEQVEKNAKEYPPTPLTPEILAQLHAMEPQKAEPNPGQMKYGLGIPGMTLTAHSFGSNDMVWLYDEGGLARRCPVSHADSVGQSKPTIPKGLYAACPICLNYHPETELNPNACPKRPQYEVSQCPVCNRPFYKTPAVLSLINLVAEHITIFHPDSARNGNVIVTFDPVKFVDAVAENEKNKPKRKMKLVELPE